MLFEESLSFDRRGGFTLAAMESEETKATWLLRHKTLGGPKLLERNLKTSAEEDEDEAESSTKKAASATPSFRSDRRIIRLLIARHFADVLERAFLKEYSPKEDSVIEQ